MLELTTAFVRRGEEVMVVRQAGGSLKEVLRGVLTAYLEDLFSDPNAYQLVYELTLYLERNPEFAEMVRNEYLGYGEFDVALLTKAANVSGATWTAPVSDLAKHMAIVVDGVTMEWLALRDDERARRHVELLGDFLLKSAAEIPEGHENP